MAETSVKKVFVIGGSAGSLDIILNLVECIPPDSKNVFIIIVHRKSGPDTILEELVASRTKLNVKEVEDKDSISAGSVYIAPPGYHLLFENEEAFSLDGSEKLHFSRPSIDITFDSPAEVFGNRVCGILLSGANADGALGMCTIQQKSGVTIAQDPDSADVGYMPRQAIEKNCVSFIMKPNEIEEYLRTSA